MTRNWERLYVKCLADAKAKPIEISPEPNLYEVRFEFPPPHLGVCIITAATCALAAKAKAWGLFPEYKRAAIGVSIHRVKYVEVDWEADRCIVVKQERQSAKENLR